MMLPKLSLVGIKAPQYRKIGIIRFENRLNSKVRSKNFDYELSRIQEEDSMNLHKFILFSVQHNFVHASKAGAHVSC
jgi:hypothetical protein